MTPPLPRGLSGRQLMRLAEKLGYQFRRGSGSHIVMTISAGGHHICIPDHKELSIGTLNDIINDIAQQLQLSKQEVVTQLFQD